MHYGYIITAYYVRIVEKGLSLYGNCSDIRRFTKQFSVFRTLSEEMKREKLRNK